jgi:hypothetical protein
MILCSQWQQTVVTGLQIILTKQGRLQSHVEFLEVGLEVGEQETVALTEAVYL